MVLDAGRIVSYIFSMCLFQCLHLTSPRQVEFGKPSELLENEKGLLRALVDESGDREKLYAMANGATAIVSS